MGHIPNIPRGIHRAAKIEAAKRGITLREWVIEAMRLNLEKADLRRAIEKT